MDSTSTTPPTECYAFSMPLRVFNSLTRQKEELVPLRPGKLGVYVCGVTVYDLSHVGHARVYVVFDTIVRFLRRDHAVTYVRNFTDVDDKIIARAQEQKQEPLALAARFADEFHKDMDALGVARPDVEPRVSTHMDEIITFIVELEQKGFAYRVPSTTGVAGAGDDVYFRVRNMAAQRYLQLSGRNIDDMREGAHRVAVDERKEDGLDFALWKSAKPGEVAWDSPFGKGRPGWHIECSAMSKKHLGVTFDLHGGGKDLIFPHHTNEIAQSECNHGEVMSRYWLHNGFINFNDEKMSKSVGNFFTIRELWPFATPEALRLLLLSTHYRGDVNFEVLAHCPGCNEELTPDDQAALKHGACGHALTRESIRQKLRFPGLEDAERRVQYIYETTQRIKKHTEKNQQADDASTLDFHFSKPGEKFEPWSAFVEGLSDDFNTPLALAAMTEVLQVANLLVAGREKERIGKKLTPSIRARLLTEAQALLADMGAIMGLGQQEPTSFLEKQRALRLNAKGIALSQVEALLEERAKAKQQKDFASADAARNALTVLGVEVRDTPDGVEWSVL